MKSDIVVSQIRMSDSLHERILRISNATGDSINGTMLNMLIVGAKFFESQLPDSDAET